MFDWGFASQKEEVRCAGMPKESLSLAVLKWRHGQQGEKKKTTEARHFSLYKSKSYMQLGSM